jgi:uncharacterized protein YneF (UPF0154 family)
MAMTSQQIEILMYLVGALLIGFIFGYFFAKSQGYKLSKDDIEIEEKDIEVEKNYSSIVNSTHSD